MTTHKQTTKAELVKKLERNCAELFETIAGFTEEQIATVPVTGEWTIKDVVGHIAYWEGVILDHVRESLTEGRPRPLTDDESNQMVNTREAAKRKSRSWARVKAEFQSVRAALVEKTESLNDAEFTFQVPKPWWGETGFYSVGWMIERDAIGHCREHIEHIKAWRAQ